MEGTMSKSIMTLAAAIAIMSLGSLLPAQAGGGASSAPSRYSHATQTQNQHSQTASVAITEFSSSSAKTTPKR
jgi:hypothetical protein